MINHSVDFNVMVNLVVRLGRRMCGGGYAPPAAAILIPGYALGSGLALTDYWDEGRM